MKAVLTLFASLLITAPTWAKTLDFDGFVTLQNGLRVYAQQYLPEGDSPTIVLLNGLTYTTKPWQKTAQTLADSGFGVLMYDMRGMGKTLEATGPATDIIPMQQQVEDLHQLLQERNLNRVDVVGLSYGGAIALGFTSKYPEMVSHQILLAPYVKALKSLDDSVQQKVKWHRIMQPNDSRTDSELYDKYLKDVIYQTYPIYEPVVKEHPWRLEAVYQMVRGVRLFKAKDVANLLPTGRTHLVVAGRDQYVPVADLNEFWSALSSSQKVTRITVQGSEHKLPEAVPHYIAGWIALITSNDTRLAPGSEFTGNPTQGTAQAGNIVIRDLPKN